MALRIDQLLTPNHGAFDLIFKSGGGGGGGGGGLIGADWIGALGYRQLAGNSALQGVIFIQHTLLPRRESA